MSESALFLPMLLTTLSIYCLLIWVLKISIAFPKKRINNAVKQITKKRYDLKKTLFIIVSAVLISLFVQTLVSDLLISLAFYVIGLIVLPYMIYGSIKRSYNERIFRNIILYCHNMSMILSQSKNVQHALTAVVDDIEKPLKDDINIVISSLSLSKNEMEEVLEAFANKYHYSIIKHLNVIIMYMQYENDNLDESLLNTFCQDINELSKEVSDNMLKRKTLRMQYFMISGGSLLAYWFMYQQLKDVLDSYMRLDDLTAINALYVFATIIVVIIIDNYFNNNMTKE